MLLFFWNGGTDMPLILTASFPHFFNFLFTVKHMLNQLDKVGSQ